MACTNSGSSHLPGYPDSIHCVYSRVSAMACVEGNGMLRSIFYSAISAEGNALQESRAVAVLVKYHANGSDGLDPLVTFEMAQIRHAIRIEEDINKSTSYWSLFSTPANRKRMRIIIAVAIFSQWRYVFGSA